MSNFEITGLAFDPLSKFGGKNMPNPRLREACGILPRFALVGDGPLHKNMENNYQFFDQWRKTETTVSEVGVYRYPGDPDMYPLCQIDAVTAEGQKETIFIYDYAMVAYMLDGEFQGSTRMD